MITPFYHITNFSPPPEPRMGMYGFGIQLNREFAIKAKNLEMDKI